MPGVPDLQLTIKHTFVKPGKKPFTPQVGSISLWQDDDGVWSGKCHVWVLDEFEVYQKDEPRTPGARPPGGGRRG